MSLQRSCSRCYWLPSASCRGWKRPFAIGGNRLAHDFDPLARAEPTEQIGLLLAELRHEARANKLGRSLLPTQLTLKTIVQYLQHIIFVKSDKAVEIALLAANPANNFVEELVIDIQAGQIVG